MANKIKLLWYGDSPCVTTGFGRVSQGILENLYETGMYDIYVLGVNHMIGEPHRYEGMFKIYPAKANGDVFGLNRLSNVVESVKPDVIVINNDMWISGEAVKHIPAGNRIITYSPVDATPVHHNWVARLVNANVKMTTYTKFANDTINVAMDVGDIPKIFHGVDTDEFYPIDDARKFMQGIPENAFIVGNVNRNQPRKRIDLFILALKEWMDRKPVEDNGKIFFYYHGIVKDMGWDIVELASRFGIDDRLLITDQNSMTASNGVSLSSLNRIYNCFDVHVMTSMGEGFGLSPLESAATKCAQVLPNHSACSELWSGRAPLITIDHIDILTGGINTDGRVISVPHLVDILDDLYRNRDKLNNYANQAYNYSHSREFTWKYAAARFDEIIDEVMSDDKYLSEVVDDDNKLSNNKDGKGLD